MVNVCNYGVVYANLFVISRAKRKAILATAYSATTRFYPICLVHSSATEGFSGAAFAGSTSHVHLLPEAQALRFCVDSALANCGSNRYSLGAYL